MGKYVGLLGLGLLIASTSPLFADEEASLGAWFERRGKHVYVRDFYRDSPAKKAGLLRGDQILAVDGERDDVMTSLTKLAAGKPHTLLVKRLPWSTPVKIEATPVVEDLDRAWLDSTRRSAQWLTQKEIAYFRVWTVGGASAISTIASTYESLLRKQPKALVIDLRGPLPNDDPRSCPKLKARLAKTAIPVVALIDRRSGPCRSALAKAWREASGAKVVGESGFITPDIAAKDQLLFAAGHDPLLQKAQDIAADAVR